MEYHLYITDIDKLKLESMDHFYNSITLLGEFYNRMHQKSHPVLIIGRSLFELLAKELKTESTKCINDPTHVFNVQFARLLLTQVCNFVLFEFCLLFLFPSPF